MDQKQFELLYYIKENQIQSIPLMAKYLDLSQYMVSKMKKQLLDKGYIDKKAITKDGIKALKPYKVDNAIIMAAGMSSRFVPLSLEKPKGLLTVKGEILIERQIEQLIAAGIKNIIIVLGYKKEMFYYLKDKYPFITLVINDEYNIKNNTNSLYLVRNYLKNSYICSSDDYFCENVFKDYVFTSYYSSIYVDEKTNEWYMEKGQNEAIKKIYLSGENGYIMLGHVYYNNDFSKKMKFFLEANNQSHVYDSCLWEQILKEHLNEFPPMQIKEYNQNIIYEFDSLEELRTFDESYLTNSSSEIMSNIATYFKCSEKEITGFKPIKEGMTNDSFIFKVNNQFYVYRHPGIGTNEIINREHEYQSLTIAKSIGVDPTFIYMNQEKGWKISKFIDGFRMPNYQDFNDTKIVMELLRKLHSKNIQVDWSFDPYQEAFSLENKIKEKGNIHIFDYQEIKNRIISIYQKIKDDGVTPRFCHCDVYSPNLLFTDKEPILIDWEYAGNADPGCDVAVYIMCAVYSIEDAKKLIKEYLQDTFTEALEYHYLAYVAICSFYWMTWALYREVCGKDVKEALNNWYKMAKEYSEYLIKKE